MYRAWDSKLDREVALKLLAAPTADQGTTVIQEGSLLARIRHPNVVTVFGADQFDGKVGLWMELIKGRALADLLVDQGPMSAHEPRWRARACAGPFRRHRRASSTATSRPRT